MSPIEFPIGPVLSALDLAGIGLFAATGAVAAARAKQTLVTFAFFALATGVGGGTVRDLLIGAPVFWIADARPLIACLVIALLIWITPARLWRGKALDWLDAVGMAAYAVFGAAKALSFGVPPLAAVMMGIFTACLGGIIRDVMAGEPSIILRPELYVTAAALAAALFVGLSAVGVMLPVAAGISALAGFGLRALAIWKGLALPVYRGG
ncbi:trimeric intracellular cation channel family protein [Parasphingopyxis sp. CP4]|uniref:trimeric intracellular cation channel family protein n=1 Tax=Parasphingopyxis sp. CP4 TaxID=2724527 RepID=UPI0015A1349D|nr:trimeric intracellular cation channel family protein [Parasphingopyxis sp. CP4]QLC22185.1 trimeric intracellular cation channel family protein [Parasphingopyxis sp. CP4]